MNMIRRSRRIGGIAAAAVMALGSLSRADDAPPKFEGGVEIVAVDASVVDGKGQPVRDLAAEEFVVKVDGRRRRVLSARFVDLRGGPAAAAPSGEDPQPAADRSPDHVAGRRIVIVVDRGQLSGGGVRKATQAAARLLDRLSPNDRVAVYSLPSGPRVGFTTDRAALDTALGRIGPAQDRFVGEFNVSLAEAISFVESAARFDGVAQRECRQWERVERARALDFCLRRVEHEAKQQVDEHQRSVDDRLSALESVFQNVAGVPGPKTVVLISGGFTSPITGSQSGVLHRLRRVATLAAAARASLYTLDLADRGDGFQASQSRMSNTLNEDIQVRGQGLEFLSGMAGGAMFQVVASADWAFDRVASEISGHYLLGLEPATRDRDGKPHDIEVKVLRRGVDVRARRQFVMTATTVPAKIAAPALRTAPPASPLRLATHMLRGDAAGQIKVLMAAQVDGFSDARFDIQVLDPAGGVVGRLAENVGTGGSGPVRHEEAVILPRGVYTLKAAAVDAAGRRASVERPLNAELSHGVGFDVSDLLILEPAGEKMRLSASGAIEGDAMAVYLELYMQEGLPTDRLRVGLEVVDAHGARRSATVLPVRQDAEKGLLYVEGLIDLWMMPPGAYVARALVTFGTARVRRVERAFDYAGPKRPAPMRQP